MLLRDIIAQGAQKYSQKVAFVFRDQPTTYAELAVAVKRLASGFASLGLQPGERIAILLPNCTAFSIAYYAAQEIGVVAVPANPLLKPAELEYIWGDADVRLVVTAPPLLAGVQAARQNLPNLRHVVNITSREDLPDASLAEMKGFLTLPELMAQGAQAEPPEPPIDENACAIIIYTSGTTGRPKGAMLSHRNLTRNIEQAQAILHFNENDSFLTALPLFHSFAGTVCQNLSLSAGASAVLLENFVPSRVLETIEKHRVTIFPGVPAMFNAILHFPQERSFDLSSLRLFVSGGAPLPATTLESLEKRFGVTVIEGDGPTECSPITSVNLPEGMRKVGSVGPPIPGVEIAIFDDDDHPLPTGEIGEIVVRGDNVMLGYLNQPEATAEVMTSGWYHTGDLGYMDEDNFVFISGRKKDMIITGGLNVYPREVEEVLHTHPAVQDVAVVGIPDALRGEEIVAVVVKKAEANVTERELILYCRERMANYKVPREILFRESVPRSGKGEIVKRLLKKELEMEAQQP